MQLVGPDHLVLISPDPEGLVAWYSDQLGLEVLRLDELAASGRFEVEMGPADLYGAQGIGRGLYTKDPDGNRVELRTY